MQLQPTIQLVVAVMKAFNGMRRKRAISFVKAGTLVVVCTHRQSDPALIIDCNLP